MFSKSECECSPDCLSVSAEQHILIEKLSVNLSKWFHVLSDHFYYCHPLPFFSLPKWNGRQIFKIPRLIYNSSIYIFVTKRCIQISSSFEQLPNHQRHHLPELRQIQRNQVIVLHLIVGHPTVSVPNSPFWEMKICRSLCNFQFFDQIHRYLRSLSADVPPFLLTVHVFASVGVLFPVRIEEKIAFWIIFFSCSNEARG